MAAQDLEASEWERSKIPNQDANLMKKLGLMKKKDALRFPSEESYPSPPIEYRLHQLTPNSILHVSIFITLCECFLGNQPNWALWKRIFCLRRNGSHNIAYNIGGVVICVRPDVEYFDVKFPDSVQGWRKRWLYVHEECSDSLEYNIASFDGKMVQDFELARPEGDRLLNALSLLEIHGDLARRSIADVRAAFTRLFPYFFPKKSAPEPFANLAKQFNPEEDIGLAFRQENLKVGVEGTIALVAESQQNIDWAKAGETKISKERWPSLIKAAKPHSKKIISFLGYKPATHASSAKPEVN
ncbi:hypothetical protein QYE76_016016 [Lolium multiflorum]|uniref:Transposase (putative) gypsy type domain-containing protein n=1 Tax=Lolium multiflorum TaxID=4521 RepID=A0AAD8XAC0_LOLMU|nr:hypothetical protein QYE76_016016 [Lolium multiflorum]